MKLITEHNDANLNYVVESVGNTFCVYLTMYSGNKLPPYYIGSTTISKINNGYCGSVSSKKYKDVFNSEMKNNRHLFKTAVLGEFFCRKDALECEKQLQIMHNAVKSNLFFNESLATPNGFFGRDVRGKANPRYNTKLSIELKQKLSNSRSKVLENRKEEIVAKHQASMKQLIGDKTRQEIAIEKMVSTRKANGAYSKTRSEIAKMNQSRADLGYSFTYTLFNSCNDIMFKGYMFELKQWCESNDSPLISVISKQLKKYKYTNQPMFLYSTEAGKRIANRLNRQQYIGWSITKTK